MSTGKRRGTVTLLLAMASSVFGTAPQQLTSAIEQGDFAQVCVLSRQMSPNTVLDLRGRTSLLVALDTLMELVKENKKSIATYVLGGGIGLFVVGTLIKRYKGEKLFDVRWQKKQEQPLQSMPTMPGAGNGDDLVEIRLTPPPSQKNFGEISNTNPLPQPPLSKESINKTFKKAKTQKVKRSTAAQIAGAFAALGGGIKKAFDRRKKGTIQSRISEQMKIITFLLDEQELDVLACDAQGRSALSRVDDFLDVCDYDSSDYCLVDTVRDLIMYRITEDLNRRYNAAI